MGWGFARTAAWLALPLVLGARLADAQTCAGGMPFNFAPLQVGLAPGIAGAGATAAASVAAGTDRVFAGLEGGMWFADRSAGDVGYATVGLGTDQPVTLDNRLHLCPIVTASYARRRGRSAAGVGGLVSIGWVARNDRLTIVPSAAIGVGQRHDTRAAARPLRQALEVSAAVGFVVGTRLALTPRIAFNEPASLAMELTLDVQ